MIYFYETFPFTEAFIWECRDFRVQIYFVENWTVKRVTSIDCQHIYMSSVSDKLRADLVIGVRLLGVYYIL